MFTALSGQFLFILLFILPILWNREPKRLVTALINIDLILHLWIKSVN
ncbi:hypothetical protein RG47T_1145 [Mucilaginibacter polytrichastri]|uniref:Uncharacterized protein n=1 Tax=Mucilaginibacter polytrichastri TaxID=1302689 RepID=A0A1Q5ZV90_9SPHI|nr:hypothetical protein RG47T_1145 [Mucilaginibacter polytrichastri]